MSHRDHRTVAAYDVVRVLSRAIDEGGGRIVSLRCRMCGARLLGRVVAEDFLSEAGIES